MPGNDEFTYTAGTETFAHETATNRTTNRPPRHNAQGGSHSIHQPYNLSDTALLRARCGTAAMPDLMGGKARRVPHKVAGAAQEMMKQQTGLKGPENLLVVPMSCRATTAGSQRWQAVGILAASAIPQARCTSNADEDNCAVTSRSAGTRSAETRMNEPGISLAAEDSEHRQPTPRLGEKREGQQRQGRPGSGLELESSEHALA